MKVLQGPEGRGPTILIHDRIINGCEDVTINEAQKIAEKYKIEQRFLDQVLWEYVGTSTVEEIESYIDHPHWSVRAAIAEYGTEDQKRRLLNDKDQLIRAIAQCSINLEVKENEAK